MFGIFSKGESRAEMNRDERTGTREKATIREQRTERAEKKCVCV